MMVLGKKLLTLVCALTFLLASNKSLAVTASATESLIDGSFGGGVVSRGGASFHALPQTPPVRTLNVPPPRNVNLSPGGLSATPGTGIASLSTTTSPLITKSSLPLPTSQLPTVTIGVGHVDPVSNKVVSGSFGNMYKLGYRIYGVEMAAEEQVGINAFTSIYDKTGSLAQAKEGFWQTMLNYWHKNPEKYGKDWTPEQVRNITLDGLKMSDQSGSYESLFGRMAEARDKGMSIEAIDAPQAVRAETQEKLVPIQQQIDAQGGITPSTIDSLKQIGNDRNSYIAANLKPGMVAEVGSLHTDGPGSINAIAASSGKPTISFDAYNPVQTPTANDSAFGGTVLNKPPSVNMMIDTLNKAPKN